MPGTPETIKPDDKASLKSVTPSNVPKWRLRVSGFLLLCTSILLILTSVGFHLPLLSSYIGYTWSLVAFSLVEIASAGWAVIEYRAYNNALSLTSYQNLTEDKLTETEKENIKWELDSDKWNDAPELSKHMSGEPQNETEVDKSLVKNTEFKTGQITPSGPDVSFGADYFDQMEKEFKEAGNPASKQLPNEPDELFMEMRRISSEPEEKKEEVKHKPSSDDMQLDHSKQPFSHSSDYQITHKIAEAKKNNTENSVVSPTTSNKMKNLHKELLEEVLLKQIRQVCQEARKSKKNEGKEAKVEESGVWNAFSLFAKEKASGIVEFFDNLFSGDKYVFEIDIKRNEDGTLQHEAAIAELARYSDIQPTVHGDTIHIMARIDKELIEKNLQPIVEFAVKNGIPYDEKSGAFTFMLMSVSSDSLALRMDFNNKISVLKEKGLITRSEEYGMVTYTVSPVLIGLFSILYDGINPTPTNNLNPHQ